MSVNKAVAKFTVIEVRLESSSNVIRFSLLSHTRFFTFKPLIRTSKDFTMKSYALNLNASINTIICRHI